MEKRDEALREVERWETWIKGYRTWLSRQTPSVTRWSEVRRLSVEATGGINLASSLRDPALSAEVGNGTTIWPRGGSAN
jgi:hypothetical protein